MSIIESTSQVVSLNDKAGTPSPLPIRIVIDQVRTQTPEYFGCLSGWQWEYLRGKILRAGLSPESLSVVLLDDLTREGREGPPFRGVTVGLGEASLASLAGKKSIDKWHLSPLPCGGVGLYLGSFDFSRLMKQYELGFYLELTLQRAKEFSEKPYAPHVENFRINPGIEETFAILEQIKDKEEIAVDVETGYGQINTVGFAWSNTDAIAINVLPARCSAETYYDLWRRISRVLSNPARKIFQNFIYDTSYFSAYGIRVEGEIFDTMHAMKVLYPEFDSNLGNVGRVFTRRSYWKDDGRVEGEEGKKKDWGNVRDWVRHYTYNCRDTTGTFEAAKNQRVALRDRGLDSFYGYVQRLFDPIREGCATGMPLDLIARDKLRANSERELAGLTASFQTAVGYELNPRSPAQVKKWLTDSGIKLTKKYDKATGTYKETTDANAIKRIRLKKDLPGLRELQEIKSLDKALSSYINFEARPDGRLSYSLNATGTETLRLSGGKDPWDRGFNIQTIPREGDGVSIKSMFLAPEGHSFAEIDLRQAESRFVAYDSADSTLIEMLESGSDVHTHVGHAILKQMGRTEFIPPDEFKKTWRQLGKKAGHALNYGMKPRTFVETVFSELDMVISVKDAEVISRAYFNLFRGIPAWHSWLRRELYQKRKLTAPSGWVRYFYGRPGDDMFKEAAAWRPQHTIPWITNHLLLGLCEGRKHGRQEFNFITQVHDSLILLVPDGRLKDVALFCGDTRKWHPEVILPGGRMVIPVEIKVGKRMNELVEFTA